MSTIDFFWQGERVVSTVTLTPANNPTALTFTTRDRTGAEVVYTNGSSSEVTNPSAGTFLLTFAPNTWGKWRVRCKGTGSNAGAVEGEFEVNRSVFSAP